MASVTAGQVTVIVPLPDDRREVALVLASVDGDGSGLMAAFNETAAPYERLQRLVIVERIPLTDLGKVKLGELQETLRLTTTQ